MVDMSRFRKIVHRSLFPREMIAGVPQAGLFIILIFAMIFVYAARIYWSIPFIVILYFVMRHFTKKDPWFIDMGLDFIRHKEKLIP